jgi:hypothetical protein
MINKNSLWVNVKDALPKHENTVLICTEEGLYGVGRFYANQGWSIRGVDDRDSTNYGKMIAFFVHSWQDLEPIPPIEVQEPTITTKK